MSDAFFGLPSEVIFCKRCVISNQRPSSTIEFKHAKDEKKLTIGFDNDGVCDACHYQETKASSINWDEREETLKELCDKHRRSDGSYDIVIPGSGGKDSAFTAHILKYKYGMNPLTVTWAPHKYTDIGWKNFENWIHEGGLDNMLLTPNGRLHRYLTQQAFVNLLHPFQPFIVGQRIIGPSLAAKFGVELVMYGENQAEYGNNLDDNYIPTMDTKFFSINDPLDIVLGGKKITNKYPGIVNLRNFTNKNEIEIIVDTKNNNLIDFITKYQTEFKRLLKIKSILFEENTSQKKSAFIVLNDITILIPLDGVVDIEKEIIKLENKKNTYNEKLKSILGKLNNKAFIEKAPDNVIENFKVQEQEIKSSIEKINEIMNTIT